MYELVQVGENTFYIESPAKIGVWRASGTDVYLIDSGNDKDAGRKIRQILDKQGWRLQGILNTHSNADHIGGNAYLQAKTGCPIFASGAEAALIRYPRLEPALVYGGYPFKDMRHKFLLAQPSDAREVTDPDFPKEIGIIPLPGHFVEMVGFRTPDDVVFLADCITNEGILQKYAITFLYDVAAQLETLDALERMEAALFIPSHAAAARDVRELVRKNRAKIMEITDTILALCTSPASFEDLLQKLFAHYALEMNAVQYVLVGSTVRSYLAWLKDAGRLDVQFSDNRMLWTRI